MGWWGYGLYSGDSPLDWLITVQRSLEKQIDEEIKNDKGNFCSDDMPAMVFHYADFLRRYQRRVGKLYEYVEWLKQYVKELKEENKLGWESRDERVETVEQLIKDIEVSFVEDKEGYRLDSEKYGKAHIAGWQVFHLTTKKHLPKIITEGLVPQECYIGWGKNKKGIYVSDSMLGALKWQFHCSGHRLQTTIAEDATPALISFMITSADEVYKDQRVDFNDDYIVCNPVPPHRLDIFS